MNRNVTSLDFNRLGSLGQASATPVGKHEDVLYEFTQYQFPLTPEEFDAQFSGEIRLFTQNPAEQCPGQQRSPLLLDYGANELDDFFWLTGISLVAFGEGKSFTIPGETIPRPAGEEAVPCFDGCPTEDPAGTQAALYWGGPTWQFLENFLYAYRFKWLIRRTEFLNVSAGALGITPMGPEFYGASDSLVPAMPYIQATNRVMQDKQIPSIFLPQNTVGDDNECVGAPTAGVTYGSPRLNGSSGRPFCLPTPLMLAPGMHLKMSFERAEGDCCYHDAMRRNSVFDPTASALPDAQLTAGDCRAEAQTIPGGCLTLGIVLLGYVMNEEACWEALMNPAYSNVNGPMHGLLKGNPAVNSLIQRRLSTQGGSIAGLPENVKGLLDAAG